MSGCQASTNAGQQLAAMDRGCETATSENGGTGPKSRCGRLLPINALDFSDLLPSAMEAPPTLRSGTRLRPPYIISAGIPLFGKLRDIAAAQTSNAGNSAGAALKSAPRPVTQSLPLDLYNESL